MAIDIHCPAEVVDDASYIHTYVTRNQFIDHNRQFFVAGDGAVRTAASIHVSTVSEKMGEVAHLDHIVDGGVFIQIEDTGGVKHDLSACTRLVQLTPVYGILHHDLMAKELWMWRSDKLAGDVAQPGQIERGLFTPVRLHGIADNGAADLPEDFLWGERMEEGEFCISDEEEPVLVSCAWSSSLIHSAEDAKRIDDEVLEKDAALRGEIREKLREMRAADEMGGPGF